MLRRAVDTLLRRPEQAQVVSAIAQAEQRTSGEIKIHMETRCPDQDPIARAQALFSHLRMNRIPERNGVLLYVAVRDRKFAIWFDQGLAGKEPATKWREIAEQLEADFRAAAYTDGLLRGVERVGAILATHFPRKAREQTPENRVSNRISGQ